MSIHPMHPILPAPPAVTLRSAVVRIARLPFSAVAAWVATASRRRALRHIAGLDDRMLSDIGLTRGDVERAMLGDRRADPFLGLERARTAAWLAAREQRRERVRRS